MNIRKLLFLITLPSLLASTLQTQATDLVNELRAKPLKYYQRLLLELTDHSLDVDDCLYQLQYPEPVEAILTAHQMIPPLIEVRAMNLLMNVFSFSHLLEVRTPQHTLVAKIRDEFAVIWSAIRSGNNSELTMKAIIWQLYRLKKDMKETPDVDLILTWKRDPMEELRKVLAAFLVSTTNSLISQGRLVPALYDITQKASGKCDSALGALFVETRAVNVKEKLNRLMGKDDRLDICIRELLKDDVWNAVMFMRMHCPEEHEEAVESITEILNNIKNYQWLLPDDDVTIVAKQSVITKLKLLRGIKTHPMVLAQLILMNIEQEYNRSPEQNALNARYVRPMIDTDYVEMTKIFSSLMNKVYPKMPPAAQEFLSKLKEALCPPEKENVTSGTDGTKSETKSEESNSDIVIIVIIAVVAGLIVAFIRRYFVNNRS